MKEMMSENKRQTEYDTKQFSKYTHKHRRRI